MRIRRVGDAVRVEPVAGLVQRRPDRLEVVRAVARRQPDVAVRERRAERVRGRVEPPGALLEAERRDDALREAPLRVGVERRRGGTTRRPRARCGRARSAPGGVREHLAHLGRRHPRLVVVEQRRVGRVGRLEALDVAALQLDVRRAGRGGRRRSRRSGEPRPRRGGRWRRRGSSRPAARSGRGMPSPSRGA